jgi:hypothetical protein
MWDNLLDWLIAFLPTKGLLGCLVAFVVAAAVVLLWAHYG